MPRILQARKGTRTSRYVRVPYVPLFGLALEFGAAMMRSTKVCFLFSFCFCFKPIGTGTCKASMHEKESLSEKLQSVANNARSHVIMLCDDGLLW